jgi:hypothetical protein
MADDAHNPVLHAVSRHPLQGSFHVRPRRLRLSTPIIRQIRRKQKAANGENRSQLLGAASLRNQMPFCHCVLQGDKEGDKNSWS